MESFSGYIVKESKVQNRVYSALSLCNKEGEIRTHTHTHTQLGFLNRNTGMTS